MDPLSGPRPEPWVRKGRSGSPMDRHCPQLRRPTAVGCRCSAQTSDARRAGPDVRWAAGWPEAPARLGPPAPVQPSGPHGSCCVVPRADVSPILMVTDPPEWVPDEACGFCTACKAPFTVIRRKHHCRSCGKVGGPRPAQHRVRGQGSGVRGHAREAGKGSGALVQSPEPQPCWEPRHLVGAWPRAGAGPAAAPLWGQEPSLSLASWGHNPSQVFPKVPASLKGLQTPARQCSAWCGSGAVREAGGPGP